MISVYFLHISNIIKLFEYFKRYKLNYSPVNTYLTQKLYLLIHICLYYDTTLIPSLKCFLLQFLYKFWTLQSLIRKLSKKMEKSIKMSEIVLKIIIWVISTSNFFLCFIHFCCKQCKSKKCCDIFYYFKFISAIKYKRKISTKMFLVIKILKIVIKNREKIFFKKIEDQISFRTKLFFSEVW